MSVANAGYRDCQVLGSYIASASQVSVSAPWRRHGSVLSVACVVFARYGHPLRFYITPYFVKRPAVTTLKLRFVPSAAYAPYRVHKKGVMQSVLRWVRARQPSALPGRCAPYTPASVRPLLWRGCLASVRRYARCFMPVACGQVQRV